MHSKRNFNGSADPMITLDLSFIQILGPQFWILVVSQFGSGILTFPRKYHFLSFLCLCHAVEKMTRNSNALKRDRSLMSDSDLVDFLSGSMNSVVNFSGSEDLHISMHPLNLPLQLS